MDDQTKYFILDAYLRKIKYNYPEESVYKENHERYVEELINEGYMQRVDGEILVTEKGKLFLDRQKGIR